MDDNIIDIKPKTKSKPTGRPSSYKPEYNQMLIDHMKQGLSLESFAAIIDVNRDTLYEWRKVHKEFSDTVRRGGDYALLHWERIMMGQAIGKIDGNASITMFNVKNRFGWKDSHQVEQSVNITVEQKEKEVSELKGSLVTMLPRINNDDIG